MSVPTVDARWRRPMADRKALAERLEAIRDGSEGVGLHRSQEALTAAASALREEGEPIDEGWAAKPEDNDLPLFWSDKAGHPETNRESVRRMTGQEPFRATLIRHPHTEDESE